MKAILKTMLILIGIVLSFKYAYAVDCNAIPGGCDNCDPWQVNERFGNTLVIPTGDPTCYFVVDFLTRTCYCDGYIKREIKINGIRKEGSNCANVTDREVFTKIYTFLLFISRDLFGVDYPTFEVGIMTPACYQWVGSTLVDCGSGCCRKSWVVTYNGRRVEVSSGGVENVACSGVVGGGCRNLCDSLDVLDGALYYPSWPSMCLDQDPCPTSPWQFNPYENYIIADVQGCRVIACYEEADCPSPSPYVKFRLKFIQLGPNGGNIRDGVFITDMVKRILKELKQNDYPNKDFFILVSYNCWTRVTGYNYSRISPCETEDECCEIQYTVVNRPQPLLQAKNIINYPGFECVNNCHPECDTLVDDNLMPLYEPLPKIAVIAPPEYDKGENQKINLTYKEEGELLTILLEGDLGKVETLHLEFFNLLGEKIAAASPNIQTENLAIFTIPKPKNLINFVMILKGNEILFKDIRISIY